MSNNKNISVELKAISELVASISRTMPLYAVPEGYFEGLAAQILKLVRQDDARDELTSISPLLSRLEKKSPFSVPEGYFDELMGNALSGLQAIELVNDALENLPASIAILKSNTTYQTPEGYFDGFAGSVWARIKQEKKQGAMATLIAIGGKRKWMRYAVAACLSGLILAGGWFGLHYSGNNPATPIDFATNLSKVSDQEILSYLDNQNVSLTETLTNNATANLDINDNDVTNILGDVSDEELKQYLDDNVGAREMVTN